MYLTVKKLVISAILVTAINDIIVGFSHDICKPLLDVIIPGNIHKPINILGSDFYFTRFALRILNTIFMLSFVYYLYKHY